MERPTRPALSRDYILRTALALIDRDGVEALSMRKLGAEMGVDPMAIYHYLPSKAAVLDGVVEILWSEVQPMTSEPDVPWTEQALTAMRAFRATLRAHPRAVTIAGTHPAVTPGMLQLLDRSLGWLTAAGLAPAEALDLINCLALFTMGQVLAEVGEPVGGEGTPPGAVYSSLDPETYPNLVAAFASGYGYRPDEQFEAGITALLAGWPARRT
jgi:AcrR family transcriptional regulator